MLSATSPDVRGADFLGAAGVAGLLAADLAIGFAAGLVAGRWLALTMRILADNLSLSLLIFALPP